MELFLVKVMLGKSLMDFIHRVWPVIHARSDLIVLWSGLVISAIGFGALLLYLALHRF
jgi:hypothetical protein